MSGKVKELLKLTESKANTKQVKEGGDVKMAENNRRSVFQVLIVDPKTGTILRDEKVVAVDASRAQMIAVARAGIVDLDKVDIGCVVLVEGFIRPKKETQKVTIEKDEKEGAAA